MTTIGKFCKGRPAIPEQPKAYPDICFLLHFFLGIGLLFFLVHAALALEV